MNPGITNRVIKKYFHQHYRQILSLQCDINRNSSAYHTVNFKQKYENRNCSFSLSEHYSRKKLFSNSILINMTFHRNIGNEIQDFSKMFDSVVSESRQLVPAEEAARIASSALPEFLKTVADWKIVHIAQNTLLNVHDLSGLPWFLSIPLAAFVARLIVTLPFSVVQVQNSGKLQLIQEEIKPTIKTLQNEASLHCSYHGWPEDLAKRHYKLAVRKEWNALVVRDNCHPAKSYILVLAQLPLWFAFSIATRNLCYMLPIPDVSAQVTYMELMVGGFGWVQNLTDVDHFLVLPVLLGLINLSINETHNLFRTSEPTRFDRWRSNLFRFICIALIPIAAYMPAATNVYWITSSCYGLLQAFLLQSPRLRRSLGVPITPEMNHPYRHFYKNLKSRLPTA